MGPPGSDIYTPHNRSIYSLHVIEDCPDYLVAFPNPFRGISILFPDMSPRLSKASPEALEHIKGSIRGYSDARVSPIAVPYGSGR